MSAIAAPAPPWPADPCSASDPMVRGCWLVEDGQIPGLDLERLRAAARTLQS